MKYFLLLMRLLSAVLIVMISCSVNAELLTEDGYVRKPIPGRSMSAAFMSIRNTSTDDIVLTSASLEGAGSVEIHAHSHKDGVMRMRQLQQLEIKAGQVVELEPGGLHLMIFGINHLPEKPELTLCDQEKKCYSFAIPVRSLIK